MPRNTKTALKRRRFKTIDIPDLDERLGWFQDVKNIHVENDISMRVMEIFEQQILEVASGIGEACLVITAPSGGGKTHILSRIAQHPSLAPFDDDQGPIRPLVGVQAPSPCVSKVLAQEIFAQLAKERMAQTVTDAAAWARVRTQLEGQCVSFLMIDELNHAFLKRSQTEIRSLVETLKNLCLPPIGPNVNSKAHPVGLILAGLPVVGDIVDLDTQLATRKKMVSIEPLSLTEPDLQKFKRFLELVEPKLKFPEWSFLSGRDMVLRFHKASNGYVGRAMRLIKQAAYIAIFAGDPSIDRVKHLGRAFEEQTKLGASRNPFLIADLSNCPTVPETAWSEPTLLRGKKS